MKPHYLLFIIITSIFLLACNADQQSLLSNSKKKASTEISLEEARTDLMNFLVAVDGTNSRGYNSIRRIHDARTINAGSVKSRSGEEQDINVHVFNFENEQGYAIMSADERFPSLIAITDSGSITDNTVLTSPAMATFLENAGPVYLERVTDKEIYPIDGSNGDNGDFNYTHEYTDWETIVYEQNGLCPVKWGQSEPYNTYCPLIQDSESETGYSNALTGCVPTSVAQLMAIYQYPSTYKDYTFNWSQMTAYRRPASGTEAADQIARLMQQLGLKENLDAHYKNLKEGTGAQS